MMKVCESVVLSIVFVFLTVGSAHGAGRNGSFRGIPNGNRMAYTGEERGNSDNNNGGGPNARLPDPNGDAVHASDMKDVDQDGIPDSHEASLCQKTPNGEIVWRNVGTQAMALNKSHRASKSWLGCSISQICPCHGDLGWGAQSDYVRCVTDVASAFKMAGLLSKEEESKTIEKLVKEACTHADEAGELVERANNAEKKKEQAMNKAMELEGVLEGVEEDENIDPEAKGQMVKDIKDAQDKAIGKALKEEKAADEALEEAEAETEREAQGKDKRGHP